MSRKANQDQVVRFSGPERVQHLLVMLLFITLALTGFPQKFHEAGWARFLVHAMGGIGEMRFVHRTAGLLFAGLALVHLTTAIAAVLAGRSKLAMVPTRKDFQDTVTTLRYYLRLSDVRAKFDRFDYREKFEYWGIVIGGLIMIVTGFVLLYPIVVTRLLPGELVPAAKVAHSNEGLMAFLVVITWHIYNVHFAPEVFPFNKTIFTGKMDRERMRHEHALEYARRFPEDDSDSGGHGGPTAPAAGSETGDR
jgi:formate dehydrogenase subunit gamma